MFPSFGDPTDHRLAVQSAHRFIVSLKETAQQLSLVLADVRAFADEMDDRIIVAKARLGVIDDRLADIDGKIVLARTAILQLQADLAALGVRVAALEAL